MREIPKDDITHMHGDEEERLDANNPGIFTWDLETGMVHADRAVPKLFGVKASAALAGLPTGLLHRIHVADRPKVAESIHNAILTGGPHNDVYSRMGKAEECEVIAFGRCFRGTDHKPKLYAGVAFKVGVTPHSGDPVIPHIAHAHRLAKEGGRAGVAGALEAILEDLSRGGSPLSKMSH